MDQTIHSIGSLSRDARAVVESLIGHSLPDDEAFAIVTLGGTSAASKAEAWNDLESMLAAMRETAAASPLSPAEIDKLIDETCHDVRYGRAS